MMRERRRRSAETTAVGGRRSVCRRARELFVGPDVVDGFDRHSQNVVSSSEREKAAVGGVYDGGPRSADGGHDSAEFEQWKSEGWIVAVFGRRLLNGGVCIEGGAKRLELREEGFAFSVRLAERLRVI